MIKRLALSITIALAALGFNACNDDPVTLDDEYVATCAAVREFKFNENNKVLENLDSVFFSIDLKNAKIFNADSMPCGTKVNKLVPVITFLDGASIAELTVKRAGQADTTYNYITNANDSIDFTNPVKLRVVSPDGKVERNYTITVNVHKLKPDSLAWSQTKRQPLPTIFAIPAEQHTVSQNGKLLCLTRSESRYCLATGTIGHWESEEIQLPFQPVINSFTATDNAIYLLSNSGELYKSADNGRNWQSTGENFHAIYGSYAAEVLGSAQVNGKWVIKHYPGNTTDELLEDMPVSGTSELIKYSFEMAHSKQAFFIGGRTADGSLSNSLWGYDGKNWAKISKRGLPEGVEYATLVPYYTFTTKYNWAVTAYPTIIAMAGRKNNGTLNRKVYVSNDFGYNWSEASSLMQLPTFIPAMYSSQAFVIESTLNGNSRVSKPVEEWQCPYIYLFGGVNASGSLHNTVWRGAINRLSFKPVQ